MKIETKDFGRGAVAATHEGVLRGRSAVLATPRFAIFKRLTDIAFAILALPLIFTVSLILLIANPIWNPGPLFFRQKRMGQGRKAFTMWKFRTMVECGSGLRDAHAPLDAHRITPLGRLMRRIRLDELPNVFNIFKGEMSLVGPRPDAFEHAAEYLGKVPRYHERFDVKPGITGLAQVRGGYADTKRAVQRKARYDSFYVRNASPLMELSIIASTVTFVLAGLISFR